MWYAIHWNHMKCFIHLIFERAGKPSDFSHSKFYTRYYRRIDLYNKMTSKLKKKKEKKYFSIDSIVNKNKNIQRPLRRISLCIINYRMKHLQIIIF